MLWSSILASIYSIWWWQVTFDEVNTAILIIPWCYTHPLPMSSGRLRPRLGTEPLRHPVDLAVRCLGWRARLVEGSNATGGVLGVWGWEIGGFNMLQPWKMLEVWALFIVENLEGLASNLGFTMMFQYGKLVFLLSNNCRSDSGFVLVFEAQDFLRSSQSCRRQIPQDRCLLPVTGAARPLLCRCCSTWTGLPPFRRWLYPWLQVGPWHFQDGGWSFCGFLCRTILTKGMKPHRSLGLEPLRFSWAHWICLDCDTWKLVGFKKGVINHLGLFCKRNVCRYTARALYRILRQPFAGWPNQSFTGAQWKQQASVKNWQEWIINLTMFIKEVLDLFSWCFSLFLLSTPSAGGWSGVATNQWSCRCLFECE